MSLNIKKMDLNDVLSPSTLLNLSGVKMGDDLKDTLDINSSRVNKNTGKYYTSTLIIYSYVKYVNETTLKGVSNKKEYIKIARNLLRELKECGFDIGTEWRDNNKLPYSKGNKKLSKDTVIINLSPASLCISKNLNMCELCGVCYAHSSERRYLNTLIYRLHQLIKFDEMSVSEIVNQFKNLRVFKWMRVNESGDIFNMDDAIKLLSISRELYEIKGVKTYLYTHRVDLWDDLKSLQTPYFKVNRSGVDFNSIPSIKSHHKSLFCDGDCNNCIYCKIELNAPVSALLHGDITGDDLRDAETRKRDLILKWECLKMYNMGCDVDEIKSHINQTLGVI